MWPEKLKNMVLVSVGAAALAGCGSNYALDLTRDREVNLARDLNAFEKTDAQLPQGRLSLREAINVALRNNLDLRVSEFQLEAAKDDAYASRLGMLPDLSLSAQRSKRDRNYRQDYINRTSGAVQTSDSQSSFRNSLTADLSLTWNVLDFGMSYIRSRQAGMEVQAQQLARMRQAQMLALEVTEVYWNAALAEDTLDYVRAIERELGQQKSMIDRSVREKRIDPIMAKDAERRLVDLELSIRDLQTEVSSSRVRLADLMGVVDRKALKLDRQPIRPLLAALPKPKQLNVEVLQDYALAHRPELFQQDLYQRIRKDDVKAQILAMFPDLTFGVGGHHDNNRLLYANEWNTAGVSIGWNLLKLPAMAKQVSAREDDVKAQQLDSMQTTLGVITQVQLSLIDYAVKVDRFMLLEESYGLANDLLEMVKAHNQAGRISDLGVTQRVLEDLAAKMRRDKSVVEVIVGYRRMLASIGLDLTHWNDSLQEFNMLADSGDASIEALGGEVAAKRVYEAPSFNREYSANPTPSAVVISEVTEKPTDATRRLIEARRRAESMPEPIAAIATSKKLVTTASKTNTGEVVVSGRVDASVVSRQPWAVQVGAYRSMKLIEARLQQVEEKAGAAVASGNKVVTAIDDAKGTMYRARYVGYTRSDAEQTCKELKVSGVDCWVGTYKIAPSFASNTDAR